MSKVLIENGLVIDPVTDIERLASLLVEGGKIKEISEGAVFAPEIRRSSGLKVIDASGMWVVPSFIDAHCHIREPGFEYKEKMHYTALAAAAGGYTNICTMPNLNPVVDKMSAVVSIKAKAKSESIVDVSVVGAMTEESKGLKLSEIGELKEAGVIALSDDGTTVMDSRMMAMVMLYAKSYGLVVISHCEDLSLTEGASVNLGTVSTLMGVNGISNASEDIIINRDIILAELTGCPLHIAHISTEYGVELVRCAKKRGVDVTAEATPHHFTLIDEAVKGYNPSAKMKPPLRSGKDVEAVKQGLADGTIDMIATDHAPHASHEKEKEFDLAPFGIVGLETAFPLSLKLVADGILSRKELIEKLTGSPAERFGIKKEGFKKGAAADLVVLDPECEWVLTADTMAGEAQNSPFLDIKLKGRSAITMKHGNVIAENM